jgi:hypothetical protein
MIERRLRAAAAFLAAAATLCGFGIIHSVRLDGSSYAVWQLGGVERERAMQLCLAYATLAAVLICIAPMNRRQTRG